MKNIFKFIVFIIIFNNYVNLWSQNSTQTEELKIWVNALYVGENNQIHLPNLAQNGQKYKVKIIDYLNAQSILHNPNEISVFIPKKIKGELEIRFYIFENEKLIQRILEIKQTVPSGGENWQCNTYNTLGTYNLVDDLAFSTLIEKVEEHVFEYVRCMGSAHHYKCQEAWANISNESSYQE
jgi:hypothetical protein